MEQLFTIFGDRPMSEVTNSIRAVAEEDMQAKNVEGVEFP